jgi:predicted nucleotidyltransferase
VPADKDLFVSLLTNFRRDAGKRGPVLIAALCELASGLDEVHREIDLTLLVQTASIRVARSTPEQPLDQRWARRQYWILFERLQSFKLGRAIKGRRNHRTRFRVHSDRPDGKPSALIEALDETAGKTGPSEPGAAPVVGAFGGPLRLDIVMDRLKAHSDEIHRLGVSALLLFGSVARDEARADSDVDLLATFDAPITSDAFFGAKFFLEDLLGRRIDLVTDSALRDRVREAITPELIRVA